jgi:hypothetical protein
MPTNQRINVTINWHAPGSVVVGHCNRSSGSARARLRARPALLLPCGLLGCPGRDALGAVAATKPIPLLLFTPSNAPVNLERCVSMLLTKLAVHSLVQETCNICFEQYPVTDMCAARCKHYYCKDCWRGYIHNAIDSGPTCLDLRCPDPECKAVVRTTCSSSSFGFCPCLRLPERPCSLRSWC